jgi:bifunctional N-acetylglucosamine-1-phosphate-uridyltransferase/glucosamine-1-phosphate-acetyltransferase GlmU-like protein
MAEPIIKKIGIRDIKCGTNVVIIEPCNLYECEIGDNTFIGPFVEIQKVSKLVGAVKFSPIRLFAN